MTDASKTKYIIGNMVIPINDEIDTVLGGNYCELNLEHIAKTYPEKVVFMEQSLMVTDFDGLDRWCKLTHPRRIADSDIEHLGDELHEIRRVLANIGTRQENAFDRFYAVLRNSTPQRKSTFFQRIFKRKRK